MYLIKLQKGCQKVHKFPFPQLRNELATVLPKFDVIASYDYFNKNKTISDKQTNYVAGVQYWFYPKFRLQAQYTYCNRHKGENSNLLQAQLQVRF